MRILSLMACAIMITNTVLYYIQRVNDGAEAPSIMRLKIEDIEKNGLFMPSSNIHINISLFGQHTKPSVPFVFVALLLLLHSPSFRTGNVSLSLATVLHKKLNAFTAVCMRFIFTVERQSRCFIRSLVRSGCLQCNISASFILLFYIRIHSLAFLSIAWICKSFAFAGKVLYFVFSYSFSIAKVFIWVCM